MSGFTEWMGREKQDWKMAGMKAAVENQEAGNIEMIFVNKNRWAWTDRHGAWYSGCRITVHHWILSPLDAEVCLDKSELALCLFIIHSKQ